MRKFLIFLFLGLSGIQLPAATFKMTSGYEKAYLEILKLRFASANSIIHGEKQANPDNLAYVYLEGYEDFLKTVISEENQNYQSLQSKKNSRLKLLESLNSQNPWKLYSMAQLNLQSCIAALKAGDYLKAGVDLKKAYNFFDQNAVKFPTYLPNKAGIGLMRILIGSVPDNYTWITGALGMKGDVSGGNLDLWDAMKSSLSGNEYPFLYQECLFLSTFVTFNLTANENTVREMFRLIKNEKVEKELTDSPLLIYAVSSFYSNQGMNDKAIRLLKSRPLDKSYFNFHYLDYLTGIALLNKLDSDSRFYFLRYVTSFKGRTFIKSAYHRIAWSYLIEGDTLSYQKYISRVPDFGSELVDADKEAMKEFQKKKIPAKPLIQSRLLFDGGYYTKADSILKEANKDLFSEKESIEYIYRLARIYHKTGDYQKAHNLYLDTYHKGRKFGYYYAANSLLNLGGLYENENKIKEALWCYNECLNLEFDEYQTSIHQKAKAAINRLKK